MSINKNNITDIDDSTLLANTPMMVVEQDGKTIAVPIAGRGGATSTKVVELSDSEVVIDSLQPWTWYSCGTITSLDVYKLDNGYDDATITFTAGQGFSASFPATVSWVKEVSFMTGRRYVVVLCGNLAAAAEVL